MFAVDRFLIIELPDSLFVLFLEEVLLEFGDDYLFFLKLLIPFWENTMVGFHLFDSFSFDQLSRYSFNIAQVTLMESLQELSVVN